MTFRIGGASIGHGYPARFIAELSNNHNGKFENALKLIDVAQAAGADFLKLQLYTPGELIALRGGGPAPEPWGGQGWSMHDLYAKAQTPAEWVPDLFEYACKRGLVPFASVFGPESLEVLEFCGCVAYKLAALDVKQGKLLRLVERTGKPITRSAPTQYPPKGDHCFLYCPSGYPQSAITFSILQNGYTGFSYHGTDPSIPGLAVQHGAKLIEAHLQLDDEPSELESNVSLTGSQFARLVSGAKRAETFAA